MGLVNEDENSQMAKSFRFRNSVPETVTGPEAPRG